MLKEFSRRWEGTANRTVSPFTGLLNAIVPLKPLKKVEPGVGVAVTVNPGTPRTGRV